MGGRGTRVWEGALAALLVVLLAPAVAGAEPAGKMQIRAPFGAIAADTVAGETPPGPGGSPYCDGDGVSGPRIQAVYGYLAGQPNNLAANLPIFRTMASAIDDAFDLSAERDGGSAHPRWAFDPGTCNLSVIPIELPIDAANNFDSTIGALRAAGLLARQDRKYVVWLDAEGNDNLISTVRFDDSPDPATNRANGGPAGGESTVAQLARNGGWDTDGFGGSMIRWGPQHEVAHMLGAVNDSAPNSDGSGHCTEELDAMCFGDWATAKCGDPNDFASIAQVKTLFDCNNDDYFAVTPAPGSYLTTHWNTYNSSFLVRTDVPDITADTTPPETIDLVGPKKVKQGKRAVFTFSSSEPGGTFECKVDKKAFKPCTSPHKVKTRKLDPGKKHRLFVFAIDAAGNADATPLKRKFAVTG